MSHLNDEALARLVDEAPTALEAAHLSVCDLCRDELQAMHGQVAQLSSLPELQPPPADWEKLERKLAAEGLIRAQAARRNWLYYGIRAAAAVALVITGALAGRLVQPTSSDPASQLATASPPDERAPQPVLGAGAGDPPAAARRTGVDAGHHAGEPADTRHAAHPGGSLPVRAPGGEHLPGCAHALRGAVRRRRHR